MDRLNLAYVITAHRNARQLDRLFRAIEHPDNTYVLHVDRKAPADVHATAQEFAGNHPKRRLIRGESITWGGWSLARVQLRAIEAALNLCDDWTHLLNLTGQDFPLRTQEEIRTALASAQADRNYMEILKFREASKPVQPRMQYFWIEWRGKMRRLFRRRPPTDLEIFWGSNYFILSRDACRYVVSDPLPRKLQRYFRWSLCPDEIFFQTALMNSPFGETIVRDHKRKIVWTGGLHPKTFTLSDREELLASDAWFARKFDDQVDEQILDVLEAALEARRMAGSSVAGMISRESG